MRDFHNTLFDSAISKINFEVSEGAFNINESGWTLKNIASANRMYFIESGSIIVEYSSKKIELHQGSVCIIPKGLDFSVYAEKPHSKLYFFFSIALPNGDDLLSGINYVLSLNIGNTQMARIKDLFFSKNIVDTMRLKNTMFEYALRMIPENREKEVSSVVHSPKISKIIDYIDKNLSIQLSIKALSEKFDIPATTLSKHFSQEVGKNIGEYIDCLVFEKAKLLLATTDLSINEISSSLGFCDRFYFSRRFKERYLTTPYKFRKLKTTTFL